MPSKKFTPNIFLISNMYPSDKDVSFGIFVKNFEDNLKNEGFKIENRALIMGKSKDLLQKLKSYLFLFYDIANKGLFNSYDLVYVHFINHTAIPVYLISILRRKPLILNAHGGDIFPQSSFGRLVHFFTNLLVKKSNLLVVPSIFLKNQVKNKYKIQDAKIFVSPSSGVDLLRFLPFNRKDTNPDLILGYISRIDPLKGWNTLLLALKELKDHYHFIKFKMIIVGGGTCENEAQKLCQDLQLNDYVTWHGIKAQEELPSLYNLFDVFVFPSELPESLGLVGLEAMACGVPVIGSNIGGIPEYLQDGQNGFIFKPGDFEDLCQKIITFNKLDPETRKRMRSNSRQTALEYDNKKVNKLLSQKINEVIGQNKVHKRFIL